MAFGFVVSNNYFYMVLKNCSFMYNRTQVMTNGGTILSSR